MTILSLLLGSLLGFAAAQFPPKPEGITVVRSKFHENVTISFKEPGICETTPGVKSYSGYVRLPPGFIDDEEAGPQDYPINTFFWFFEARKDPENAPLAIWLNGGPGATSVFGLLEENGPCLIEPDSKSTRLNPWSWNNEVNMLYIDQPTQVGFSYDIPTNCTVELEKEYGIKITPADFSDEAPVVNLTHMAGTFSSQDPSHTVNSTAKAAYAVWHFAQTWFTEFPHYKPADDRISLWAESYGGHYGPEFMHFFQKQNDKIKDGTIDDPDAHYLHLDTLGIVNAMIDYLAQGEGYITFPYNNTYGIQVFNDSIYDELMYNWTQPNGCKDQIAACQSELKNPPKTNVTKVCSTLQDWCNDAAGSQYQQLNSRAWLDIGHGAQDPFPAPTLWGYLTQEPVLAALGVPVNLTAFSRTVSAGFDAMRDLFDGRFLAALDALLARGVKVHLLYGDRDYACNWVGGEAASLAVTAVPGFSEAGYAPFVTEAGDEAGRTRQVANYSFTRVYQAGHEIPAYQPEAAYDIFVRAMFGRDVATGRELVTDDLVTEGPSDTWHIKNEQPEIPAPRCYILKPETCTPEIWERVRKGEVTVKDWYVVEDGDDL